MPFRSWLAAFALVFTFRIACAEEKVIKDAFDLKALSAYLPTATGPQLIVRIDNYANPGQLKLDQASGTVGTLTLQRFSSDSDGVINVDSTFIDIKGFAGHLILKGLAFRLKPKAALIAGFDPIKPNHNLTLDSCFLYSENIDGTILAWQGDPESRIEIKNSWFVTKASTLNKVNLQVAGGDVLLTNNLFNFPGTITGSPISRTFTMRSNTMNRVQVILVGTNYGGSDPIYSFSQNLAAYHGAVNAVGGESYFVLKTSSFNGQSSTVTNNRMYRGEWRGIDATVGANKEVNTDSSLSNSDGKSASELWDWYTKDASTGMLSGNNQTRRYNVLPTMTSADTGFEKDSLRVLFKRADFPRMFQLVRSEYSTPLEPSLRMRAPFAGKLYFGPFQIDSVRVKSQPIFGKPILLAQTDSGAFMRQASNTSISNAFSWYVNKTPKSRTFILADSGNTPRGTGVEPSQTDGEPYEHIRFGKVTASGQTKALVDKAGPAQKANDLRLLGRNFVFKTTASVQDTLTFATLQNRDSAIWSLPGDSALYWLWYDSTKGMQDRVIPARAGSVWGDTLLQGSVPYEDSMGTFRVFLVEKLSMPAGNNYRKPIPGAELLSYSKAGYQIYTDTPEVDTLKYGSPTKGYSFRSTGRGAQDSLFLILPKPESPESQVFVQVPTKAEAEPLMPPPSVDSQGNYKIRILAVDTGKTFFAAVKYNIIANDPFEGVVNGVSVRGLVSSVSGRLSFSELPATEAHGLKADTVFRNTRYLAGRAILAPRLKTAEPFTVAFQVPAGATADSGFEAWALVKGVWKQIPGPFPSGADTLTVTGATLDMTHIVAVKRFQAPETYATPTLNPARTDSLVFNLGGKDLTATPIQSYCLEVRAISLSGEIRNLGCEQRAPGDTVRVRAAIDSGWAYAYRVVYFLGKDKDTVAREFQYPPQFAWDSKKALDAAGGKSVLKQGTWHLVSVPTGRISLSNLLKPLPRRFQSGDTVHTVLNLTLAMGISNPDGKPKFDTLTQIKSEKENQAALESLHLERSEALLIASSHPDSLQLDGAEGGYMKAPKPESLAVDPGWNFVGNPYPIRLRKECVRSSKGTKVQLLELVFQDEAYSWEPVSDSLDPFAGFAFYSPQPDILIYDPAAPPAAPAAKKQGAGTASIPVALVAGGARSAMTLVRGEGEYPIGYLPAPAARMELRVGGKGGYWIKPIADPRRIDEPVEIRSAGPGTAAFSVGEGVAFLLIDEATGQAFDPAAARALPLRAGSQDYRLIAGDPGFVAERARSIASAAPVAIGLSQNFPNPARGLTRIALEWPLTRDRDRQAALEVLDTRGRRVAFRKLEGMKVGRQLIELDAPSWKPGVYVYRLVVRAEGKVSRLQRKLLVAP